MTSKSRTILHFLIATSILSGLPFSAVATESPKTTKPSVTQPKTPTSPTAAPPKTVKPVAPTVSAPKKPEIGAISRATGHLFREGLTADFSADSSTRKTPTLKSNENGLITSAEQGAFTPELWAGLTAPDLEKLLEPMTVNPAWPHTLPLARRLLLTDAPWPGEMPNESSLIGLRLEKMIRVGASDEAARLYTHLSPDHPNPRFLMAGVQSLILAGNPSVACLEVKANAPQPATGPTKALIDDLMGFCTTILAREAQTTAPVAVKTPNTIEQVISTLNTSKSKSSPLSKSSDPQPIKTPEKSVIFKAAQPVFYPQKIADLLDLGPIMTLARPYLPGISYEQLSDWTLPNDLNPEQASILARDPGLPDGLRLKLFAGSTDITPPVFTSDSLSTVTTIPQTPRDPAHEIWSVTAALYREQQENPAHKAAARSGALLDLFPFLPPKIQLLFVPSFENLPASSHFTPTQHRQILSLLLQAGSPATKIWVKRLIQDLPATPAHDPEAAALLLLSQMQGESFENTKLPFSFSQARENNQVKLLKIFKNLSDLLDNPPKFIDNPPEVYEKRSGLTEVKDYVIPLQALRKHLREAREKGQIGRLLLASLLALQTQGPQEIDPDVLALTLKELVAAGLREEARQIATTALLGVTTTGDLKNGTSRPSGTTETKPASVN